MAKAKKRIKNRLAAKGIEVREMNLYDSSVELLEQRGDWDEVLEVEPDIEKAEFAEMLQSMLNPEQHLAPAIRERLEMALTSYSSPESAKSSPT